MLDKLDCVHKLKITHYECAPIFQLTKKVVPSFLTTLDS